MLKTAAYSTPGPKSPLAPTTIERREPGPKDVLVHIDFCGICHSDLHQARDEWGNAKFPMVPGHEIVGRVARVGNQVTQLKVGDRVGVGCIVDSCGDCEQCRRDREQFCARGPAFTYNGFENDKKTATYGGYSQQVVVTEKFVLRIPEGLDPAGAAPLLCAGITTYSPLRQHGVKKGHRVGVVGLGGLGHMAVKLAASMGADVTVFSTSKDKEKDARRLGAKGFAVSKDAAQMKGLASTFDFLVDTVSAPHDYNAYLALLRAEGTMILVGVPPEPVPLQAFALLSANKKLAGSMIGGIAETQEMLDYCGQHNIVSDIETISIDKVNEAYERMLKGDVRYRFVIDLASLKRA